MAALNLIHSDGGGLTTTDLPLRMPHASGVVDPEPFRLRSRVGPALAEAFDLSGGMRSLHLPNGGDTPLFDLPVPVLTFVISGTVTVSTDDQGKIVLQPGDVFLFSAKGAETSVTPGEDCRLIQVLVEPEWPGPKARMLRSGSNMPRAGRPPNLKRMVTASDERSYFHSFDALFGEPNRWSAIKPLTGFRFIGMAEDTFIDWHPEIVNNFVIVMSGALELEVGGTAGAIEIFRQGDVCLAEDRTGQGHIDRVHGYVQVAVLIIGNDELWPLPN